MRKEETTVARQRKYSLQFFAAVARTDWEDLADLDGKALSQAVYMLV